VSQDPEVPRPSDQPDPFQADAKDLTLGGARWADYIAAMRLLQDRVAETAPPPELVESVTGELRRIADRLSPYRVDEEHRISGRRPDLPGRGGSMLPPVVIDEESENSWSGHVTFNAYHLGGNGAAHGGIIPFMFDDFIGRQVNSRAAVRCRTAYLHVNYRRITPVGRRLTTDARIEKVAGRKWFASGRLWDGDDLCADADALFVVLLPGQP
jgi:acyl-coenzyme A thioesterase PaaI-like protein